MSRIEHAPRTAADPAATEPGRPPRRRWCRGTRIAVTAATAWLGFVSLHYLLSGRWWVWELVELLPPRVLLVVPLVMLAGLAVVTPFRRLPARPTWWLIATLVTALALGAGTAGINLAALRGEQPAAAGADAVRVLAWNTEHWDQGLSDPDALYAYLRAQRADVYLLQEYLHRGEDSPLEIDDLDRLRREFPDYELVAVGGLLTMSRYPIESWQPISVAPKDAYHGSDWSDYYLTKVLRTDLRIGSQVVSFYNAHIPTPVNFRYSPRSRDFYRYTRQAHPWRAAVLAATSADLSENCHPIVVAGDFNLTSLRRGVHPLDRRLRDAITHQRSLFPGTWALREVDLQLWRLDYAFTTSELAVHRYEFRDTLGLSDHSAQYLVTSLDPRAEVPPCPGGEP